MAENCMASHPARGDAGSPGEANELLRQGAALLNAGRASDAARLFEKLVELRPDDAHAHHRLGDAAAWSGDLALAIKALRRSVELDVSNPGSIGRLGNVLRQSGDLDGAIDAFSRALAIAPDSVPLLENLGEALVTAARPAEALTHLTRALTLAPGHSVAHLNLASALIRLRRCDEAMINFERAVELAPDLSQAHLNLAMALLMRGEWERGWRELEWRLRLPRRGELPGTHFVRWRGQSLANKRILLRAEQGYGDVIQFARYVPLIAERGGKVILQCARELSRLLENLPGIEQVITVKQPPACDFECPLMSLPLVFESTLENLPSQVPYLDAPPALCAHWSDRLRETARPRVGITWAGNPSNTRDRYRSMSFEQIAPLVESPVRFVNLQKDRSAESLRSSPLSARVLDPTPELHDWADTAALLSNLDLVITVDTSVAHLSGAMGKPTWTMLSFGADWRWMLDRNDSPWYPTMRLFRQERLGDWESVVDRVKRSLTSGDFLEH
jgi:tetratricopeptide (TPR) repeat protein